MRIRPLHRKKLTFYLKQFYRLYANEKYTIFHFIRFFKLRLKDNKDAWMGVCGETGTGKSYLAIMSMILFGRPMTLTKNIAYVPKGNEIIKMFDKLNFQCLLIDEAAREMRSVNWQSKQQQGVNVRAMTERFKNNWVMLNMPNFNEFTKSMRRGNLLFRAIVIYRNNLYARVIIQRRSRNWRSDDPWGDKLANDKYEKTVKRYKEISNDIILKIERSLPNTVMDFIIPNLELILPDITNEYINLKEESRKIAEKEDAKKMNKDKWKKEYKSLLQKVIKLIYFNKLGLGKIRVSKKDMAKSIGISFSTFDKYLNMEDLKNKEKGPVNPRQKSLKEGKKTEEEFDGSFDTKADTGYVKA